MRWGTVDKGGGGRSFEAQGPTIPLGLPPCTRPGQGDCFRPLRRALDPPSTPTPRLAAVPRSCLPHPRDSWERGQGRRAGRSCSAPGLGPGRCDMKEPGPAGVAGRRKPPAVASLRAPYIWPTGAISGVGGGKGSAPDTLPRPALPGKGRSDGLPWEWREDTAWGAEPVSLRQRWRERHRACLGCGGGGVSRCRVRKASHTSPPAGPCSWGSSSSPGLLCPSPLTLLGGG